MIKAAFLNSHITRVNTLEEVGEVLAEKGGYVKMNWCGEEACELKIKKNFIRQHHVVSMNMKKQMAYVHAVVKSKTCSLFCKSILIK